MEKSRLERRVREMPDVVSLGEFEARRPHQLSGRAAPAGGPRPRPRERPEGAAAGQLPALDREQRRQMQLELAASEPPPERIGLPVTCSDVVFQGALLRCA